MFCNGPSADEMSFDIIDENGVISNNEAYLSTIDLSDVHVPCSQYTNDMKVIDPYGLIYIKGVDKGSSYTTKAFGKILDTILAEDEYWLYNIALVFHIKFVTSTGKKVVKCVRACGSIDDDKTAIESCQELFDNAKLPITVEYKDNYVYFTSTQLGFDFWISMVELWFTTEIADDDVSTGIIDGSANELGFGYDDDWIETNIGTNRLQTLLRTGNAYEDVISETEYRSMYDYLFDVKENTDSSVDSSIDSSLDSSTGNLEVARIFLFEDLTKYVPSQKYRNGAMKGCVVKATYPVYNAANIPESMRALKIGHLTDRIEDFIDADTNKITGLPLYARIVRDVVDSYYSQYEFDLYNKWSMNYGAIDMADDWIDPEEVPYIGGPQELYMKNFKCYHRDNKNKLVTDWTHSQVPVYYMINTFYKTAAKYEAVGLYGYATYLTKRNLWMNMGQLYIRTSVDDDESLQTKNLIPSFIIYNPNNFPVTVNYMTFA